jgi:hypothetical protein
MNKQPLFPEPAIAADRKIEAGPLRQAVSKADVLRNALRLLGEARSLAVENQIDGEGGGK